MSWWELQTISRTLSNLKYKMASVLSSVASLNARVSTLESATAPPPPLLQVNTAPVSPDDASVITDAALGKLVRLQTSVAETITLNLAPADVSTGTVFTFVNTNALGGLNIQIDNGTAHIVEIAPRETIRLVYVGGETGWVPF